MLISVADFKKYAKITSSAIDAELTAILNAAIKSAEGYCNWTFETATHTEYLRDINGNTFYVKNLFVTAVTSIEERDGDNVLTSIFNDTDTFDNSGLINNPAISMFKGYQLYGLSDYKIVYVGGYTDTNIPADLKHSLMLLALHKFNETNLEGSDQMFLKSSKSESGAVNSTISYREFDFDKYFGTYKIYSL